VNSDFSATFAPRWRLRPTLVAMTSLVQAISLIGRRFTKRPPFGGLCFSAETVTVGAAAKWVLTAPYRSWCFKMPRAP
jgi:hypothetical protein